MERVAGIGGYFLRASDPEAMIAQLRVAGAEVDDQTQQMDGIGRFGWVTDPEGNRIELWEPEGDS